MVNDGRPSSPLAHAFGVACEATFGPDDAVRWLAVPDLEARLGELLGTARAAWPGVSIEDEAFLRYLAEHLEPDADTADLLRLRIGDLFVACGCAAGDPASIRALESHCLLETRGALQRMRLTDAVIEDALQNVRRVVFAGDEVAPARIREYAGQGDIRGWLRVTAVRAALKVVRKGKREVLTPDDANVFTERTAGTDPELLYIKAKYRKEFAVVFQAALDSLEERDRTILKQHVIDELSIDEIGALYQVHRATAARWLAKAREDLLGRTREKFMKHARVSREECESILRLVQSQLDATIRRRLAHAAGDEIAAAQN